MSTEEGGKASPEQEARALIKTLVATGFDTRDEIIDDVADFCEGFSTETAPTEAFVATEVDKAIEAHIELQASWPPITDCNRLDCAFDEMNELGILALQHFACCQTCGFAEIEEEIAAAKSDGIDVHGFVFYHRQDTETAVQDGEIHLSYGAVIDGQMADGDQAVVTKATIALMDTVVATLARHGLKATWERTLAKRLHIALNWKRRLVVALH